MQRTAALIMIFLGSIALAVTVAHGAPTVVHVWEEERLEIQQILDQLIDDFNRQHAGKIQVKRSHFGTEDLRINYQTAVLGGGGPELLLAPNDFGGVFQKMGVLLDTSSFYKEADFAKILKEAVTGRDGGVWGVPLNMGNHLLLYVNTKLTGGKVPQTIPELEALKSTLLPKGKGTHVLAFNMFEPLWLAPFFGLSGERPLVAYAPNLEHEGCRNGLALLKRWVKEGVIPGSCDYSCAETLFLEGKAAMTINGDWAIEKYAKHFGDALELAPLPKAKDGVHGLESMLSGKYFFLRRGLDKAKLQAASDVVAWFSSEKVQMELALKSLRLPAIEKLQAEPRLLQNRLVRASAAATKAAYPMPFAVEMRAVWDAMRQPLRDTLSSADLAPEAACHAMQIDAVRRIKEMKQ